MRERITMHQTDELSYTWLDAWYGTYSVVKDTRWRFDAMWDVETPDFRQRMRTGEIINNPMYKVRYDANAFWAVSNSTGTYSETTPIWYNWRKYHDTWNAHLTSTAAIDAYLEPFEAERSVAINKAWANVDVSEIQALASLGELPETLRWFASIQERLIALLRMFSKRQLIRNGKRIFSSARSAKDIFNPLWKGTTAAGDFWLEFRYAVRPLVFEAVQATNAMHGIVEKGNRMTARGFHNVSERTTITENFATSNLGTYDLSYIEARTSKYRAGVLVSISDDINGVLALWGLDQPLETAWELTTLSFVLDWFFNVGDTIAAWTVNPSLHPLTSWVTEEHYIQHTGHKIDNLQDTEDAANYDWSAYNCQLLPEKPAASTMLLKRRTVCPPRALLPQPNLNLDLLKILDLAAIGRGLFETLRRH